MRKFVTILASAYVVGVAQSQVTTAEVLEAAMVLGMNAETLACADIHGSEVTTVLDRLAADFDAFQTYRASLTGASEAYNAMIQARAATRLDPTDTQLADAFATAITQFEGAQDSAEQLRQSLVRDLTESLADSGAAIAVIQCSFSCSVPAAYRPAGLVGDEARVLGWALRLRDCNPTGSMPGEATAAISAAESQTSVQLAMLRRNQHTLANQSTIDEWVVSEE